MATNEQILGGNVSLTREKAQRKHVLVEEASVGIAGTFTFQHPALANGEKEMPARVVVYTHDGGMTNGTVAATYVLSDGDTLDFQALDPASPLNKVGSAADINNPANLFLSFTHTLSGVTAGAATAAEIAASLNGDATFAAFAYADGGNVTTNAVTIFPKGISGEIKVTGGTVQTAMVFPAGGADNKDRTLSSQPAADWSWTYATATGLVTVTNGSGAAVDKVAAHLSYF